MPHIIVFCFPAMKFEAGPGLRAHPLSARRSRRSHESLGHNRSPRGRFGKMNMSGKTHLNALHRCVAILKHAAASPVASAQSGQPLQSVRLIRSHRGVQSRGKSQSRFSLSEIRWSPGVSTPRNGDINIPGVAERRMKSRPVQFLRPPPRRKIPTNAIARSLVRYCPGRFLREKMLMG